MSNKESEQLREYAGCIFVGSDECGIHNADVMLGYPEDEMSKTTRSFHQNPPAAGSNGPPCPRRSGCEHPRGHRLLWPNLDCNSGRNSSK